MGFLNGGDYRFGTQGRQLRDIGGSTVRGCGDYCDNGNDVENGVTPIEIRLLRKGKSSDSDTRLKILNE